jgi:hypothetical protein
VPPAVTWDLGSEGPPHLVAFYDTRGDVCDLLLFPVHVYTKNTVILISHLDRSDKKRFPFLHIFILKITFMYFRNVFYIYIFTNCLGQKFEAVAGATSIEKYQEYTS